MYNDSYLIWETYQSSLIRGIRFYPRFDDMILLNVNVGKIDKAWRKNNRSYIGRGGSVNAIGNRYEKFIEFLKKNKKIEASEIYFKKDGTISFDNGRHRFAVLRDLGMDRMDIAVRRDNIDEAEKYE